MNKILKRVISGVTSLSLGMALIGTMPAIAEETAVTSKTVRTMSVDFMGRGAMPQDSCPGSARLTSEDIGKEFWVGVAVDKVNDLPLFTDGIYSLEIAFEYDPKFVEPYFTTSGNAEAEWTDALKTGNLTTANNSAWWNSDQYEIISVTETDIDTVTDRENSDKMVQRADDGWKMCTVCVTLKDGVEFGNARFKSLSDTTKQYLLKLPFKLNSVPADDAVDTNPNVLSLVRGPETLDIGSGEMGINPYSAWEATVKDSEDVTNMKNLFAFPGDISLFDSSGAIENIVPVKTKTDEEESDTSYTLSTGKDLTLDGFKIETFEYYLSVSNEVEKIKLNITSSELPEVTANSERVDTTTISDKMYDTVEFKLNELDKTVETDGYNNTVTVTAGGVTYTIYIRRLLKPKIELNPGNSPYGLIEQMSTKYLGEEDGWSDEKIEQAKENFEKSNCFSGEYIPNDALDMRISNNYITYRPSVWGDTIDPDVNMDRNSEAIFIYNGLEFKDPGFKVINSYGENVSDPYVKCSIKLKRMLTTGTAGVLKTTNPDAEDAVSTGSYLTYDNIESGHLFTNITSSNPSINKVCPGVYDLEYSTIDPVSNEEIKATRKVIALFKTGDTDFSCDISPIDINSIKTVVATGNLGISGASELISQLYVHRIQDTDNSGDISPIDLNAIKRSVASNSEIQLYYKALPCE